MAPFTAGVQSYASLAELVVEDDGVHWVFAANSVRVPRQDQFEFACLSGAEQSSQAAAGVGRAIARDRFVGEPLDDLTVLAGSEFGDFRALFGGRFVLLLAADIRI